MMTTQHLWTSQIHIPPAGLRECVLRVRHLSAIEAKRLAAIDKFSLWHRVARWRVEDPVRWAVLLTVMGLPAFQHGRSYEVITNG